MNLNDIEILVVDVDGVLTDGGLVINGDGSEAKIFNVQDGHGIKLWQRVGLKVAFLSGRPSEPTLRRAEQLKIDYCLTGCLDKLPRFKELLKEAGLQAKNAAFVGDDLPDLPAIRYAGFGVAVVERQHEQATSRETLANGDDPRMVLSRTGAVREQHTDLSRFAGSHAGDHPAVVGDLHVHSLADSRPRAHRRGWPL